MLLVDLSESVRGHGDAEAAADSLVADDTSDRWAHRRELQQFIRQKLAAVGLKPHKSLDHALVLETIASAPNREAADVNGIYKMLCDDGQPLFMSKLYRVLKALEQVGLLERSFEEDKHGRVRSVYRVQGLSEQPRPQSRLICRSCGATTLSSSVNLGREIATAAREGGLPIVGDAVVVYVNCESCSAREGLDDSALPGATSRASSGRAGATDSSLGAVRR